MDLPGEKRGLIPNAQFYDKAYRGRWNGLTVISIAIGQGEILATPLQIANMACVLANRGYYMTPHIVRPIEGANNQVEKHTVDCDRKYFDIVVEGMAMAASSGTARGASIDSHMR